MEKIDEASNLLYIEFSHKIIYNTQKHTRHTVDP